MEVPSATAVPIGLIVNELVTNALKYAFPAGRQGMIKVALRRTEDDEAELVVADDGIGIPDSVEAKGLGTRLTESLCRQLGGTIMREAGNPGCRVVTKLRLSPHSAD